MIVGTPESHHNLGFKTCTLMDKRTSPVPSYIDICVQAHVLIRLMDLLDVIQSNPMAVASGLRLLMNDCGLLADG